MTDGRFHELVEEGIKALPSWVHASLTNVAFLVREKPGKRVRREHGLSPGDTLFGLYEGVPLTLRGSETPILPDTITVFKQPILDTYTTEEDIAACIRNTIWHEVAHYFGHDEAWVEAEEVRRGKLL